MLAHILVSFVKVNHQACSTRFAEQVCPCLACKAIRSQFVVASLPLQVLAQWIHVQISVYGADRAVAGYDFDSVQWGYLDCEGTLAAMTGARVGDFVRSFGEKFEVCHLDIRDTDDQMVM